MVRTGVPCKNVTLSYSNVPNEFFIQRILQKLNGQFQSHIKFVEKVNVIIGHKTPQISYSPNNIVESTVDILQITVTTEITVNNSLKPLNSEFLQFNERVSVGRLVSGLGFGLPDGLRISGT